MISLSEGAQQRKFIVLRSSTLCGVVLRTTLVQLAARSAVAGYARHHP